MINVRKNIIVKNKLILFSLSSLFFISTMAKGFPGDEDDKKPSYFPKHYFTHQPSYTPPQPDWRIFPNGQGFRIEHDTQNGTVSGGFNNTNRSFQGSVQSGDNTFYGQYNQSNGSGHIGIQQKNDGCNMM